MAKETLNKNYSRKISTSTIGLFTRELEDIAAKAKGKAVPVSRIYGIVRNSEPGQTDIGPYIKFSGEFEAINLVNRSVHRAKTLVLPAVAESFVNESLQAAKAESPDASVTIGMDITVTEHKSAKGGTKFKYGVSPLTSPGNDPLTELGNKFGELPSMLS